MTQSKHLVKARDFAEQSAELLPEIDDPGVKAQTLALLAIAHAVLETGFDIDNVRSAIESNG
ncbi:hypothetical protein PV411_38825 [Streptomyces sp. NRRL_B-16638]|jgi:hypothetical protein|uniref:Uncharacterized protein n=1 Tax=Streptomyces coelicolor (strain ATCC BAA-471 / A3(2) / M145) TaxID=100226 RepID=Q8VWE1_STRCO|nr:MULTISPECIES: hypothetical protein [Streptomyces]MDX2930449.1 hypothetical protein [Streptomyces sp. NRRL_B-16638]CAD12001.1 hypothetical protein [Streptomyces coelicolor A3(2)]